MNSPKSVPVDISLFVFFLFKLMGGLVLLFRFRCIFFVFSLESLLGESSILDSGLENLTGDSIRGHKDGVSNVRP